jgi:hypothetical protein
LRLAEQAADAFDPVARRFTREVATLVNTGQQLLGTNVEHLSSYLAGNGAGGAGYGSGYGAGGGGEGGLPAGVHALPGMPEGWAMVPLALIRDDNPVTGPRDYTKSDTSSADHAWGFEALHEVLLPALAAGKGVDYFRERDQAEGRRGNRSYADTYSGFFSDAETIKLDWVRDHFDVGNGRHRLWVATQLGLDEVPARVR